MQVIYSGVAHITGKVESSSYFNFPLLQIYFLTFCVPCGPVVFWHQFPLVGLVLGSFVEVLNQIWKDKRLRCKLTEWERQVSWRTLKVRSINQEKCLSEMGLCNSLITPTRVHSNVLDMWGAHVDGGQLWKWWTSKGLLWLLHDMWEICWSKSQRVGFKWKQVKRSESTCCRQTEIKRSSSNNMMAGC